MKTIKNEIEKKVKEINELKKLKKDSVRHMKEVEKFENRKYIKDEDIKRIDKELQKKEYDLYKRYNKLGIYVHSAYGR